MEVWVSPAVMSNGGQALGLSPALPALILQAVLPAAIVRAVRASLLPAPRLARARVGARHRRVFVWLFVVQKLLPGVSGMGTEHRGSLGHPLVQ